MLPLVRQLGWLASLLKLFTEKSIRQVPQWKDVFSRKSVLHVIPSLSRNLTCSRYSLISRITVAREIPRQARNDGLANS